MCWTGLKDEAVHKVAQSNIPVTKIVKIENEEIVSYFNGFKYVIGKVYKTNIGFSYAVDIFCEISRGFHSYINERLEKTPGGIKVLLTNSAFQMYYNKNLINIPYKLGILYCVIPKGSIYYQNKAGEIVSDTIKPIYCYGIK